MMTLAALSLALSFRAHLQAPDLRPALQIKAIVGATVQISPTRVLKNATVIIDGKTIKEVAVGAKVPAGADVIDGKGLTVYAGFVDSFSTKGLSALPETPRQTITPDTSGDVVTQMRLVPADNHANVLGADLLNPDDSAWSAARSAGFTSALVSPSTGFIPGQPSLVDTSGKPRFMSTIVPSVGFDIKVSRGGFGFGGGYPATPLGYFASVRQAFFDAQQFVLKSKAYAAGNPHWPSADPASIALAQPYPVLLGADTASAIDRVLDFGQELNRPTVLVGGAEAYKLASRVKAAAKAVILTLDFGPEPLPPSTSNSDDFGFPGERIDAQAQEAMAGAGQAPAPAPGQAPGQARPAQQRPGGGGGGRRRTPTDPDEPQEKKKENEALWLQKVKNAASLEKAGIAFAVSSEGLNSPDELLTNLRRAVKEGLSPSAALAALTTVPASFFGVSRSLGTIEPGKIANLTILTSDLFNSSSKVKYLFIDGEKIDPAKAPIVAQPPMRFGEED